VRKKNRKNPTISFQSDFFFQKLYSQRVGNRVQEETEGEKRTIERERKERER